MPAVSEEEIQEGITRNIIREVDQLELTQKEMRSKVLESQGVNPGYLQADILARTLRESNPYLSITERESTNVDDQRMRDDDTVLSRLSKQANKVRHPDVPYADPRFDIWSRLIQDSDGLVEDLDDIIQEYNSPRLETK